ncbi:methyltransferase domain-containing protein [Heliobacterium undosum]|uniref:Methyltransferase domain-containing protein n=1 Tax=Heliomicrobium undosum TaxID=121734 RepID=A0A845L1K9_9FIRM|nr:class I SAM-dependent methyltransferase [Heliomicrobium undosum]MZP29506.1 methyltransferase domain-containing protein [Heliomicrobium undosum]
MKRNMHIHLNDPRNGEKLKLYSDGEANDKVEQGLLEAPDGYCYPVVGGVPRFLSGFYKEDEITKDVIASQDGRLTSIHDEEVKATRGTFSDKWTRFKNYGFEEKHREFLLGWYVKKLGLDSVDQLKDFYVSQERILEVGPGSGFNTRFMAEQTGGTVMAADLSEAAITTYENTRDLDNVFVVQADLMELPFPDEYFTFIIADGVLHHTPSTKRGVERLYGKLAPGGSFFFYVYKKMGPVREFCDAYIREQFVKLTTEECYKACEPLTDLGRELSRLNAKITLDKPIDILGIPAGTHDVQRLFYYSIAKCFWNEAFDYETNNMVNYDWYHPHFAWKHTEQEIAGWLEELGCKEYKFNDANPNGISVLLKKPR